MLAAHHNNLLRLLYDYEQHLPHLTAYITKQTAFQKRICLKNLKKNNNLERSNKITKYLSAKIQENKSTELVFGIKMMLRSIAPYVVLLFMHL